MSEFNKQMKDNQQISHPWKLIGDKLFFFSILHLIYKLPISYKSKTRCKQKFFYDKFAKYTQDQFRLNDKSKKDDNLVLYDMGQFKICIFTNSDLFPIESLEWNLSYEYLDIIYPSLNPRYFKFILGEGPYELGDIFCEKGDYVLDAGANLGIFSFLASLKVGDNGHVYGVEPMPFFAKCLKESIRINASKNISLLEVAIGNENKEVTLNLDSENPMNSGKAAIINQSITVNQNKIDSLLDENKITRLNFLKMDIEGSEREALHGARETIFKYKPKLSICTYHLKDDPIVIRNIIKHIDPKYKIIMGKKKIYARI